MVPSDSPAKMILYLAKRAKPECLAAVSYLAMRVNKRDSDNVELMWQVRCSRSSKDIGMVLRMVSIYSWTCHTGCIWRCSHTVSCALTGDLEPCTACHQITTIPLDNIE